jgi:hypothetical protein
MFVWFEVQINTCIPCNLFKAGEGPNPFRGMGPFCISTRPTRLKVAHAMNGQQDRSQAKQGYGNFTQNDRLKDCI